VSSLALQAAQYREGAVAPRAANRAEPALLQLRRDRLAVSSFEPGRLIAGNARVLISRVEYVKERDAPLKEGDLVAFMTAGAYGATLSSQYNSRPMVAEALVRGNACVVVRRRPTFEEMIALERAPDWIA
jgi:diaminopimelate decarboxylase